MDFSEVDKIVFGRIEPHIYAFNTNSIPNYLKIGDTYRPVKVRLAEWRKYFPNLTQQFEDKAAVTEDVYFRDYSIHQYLETEKRKHRLTQKDLAKISAENRYYSNEFFKETSKEEISEAINDIKLDFAGNTGKYQFYSKNDKSANSFVYERSSECWTPRPNQQEAIENYLNAVKNGRTNLLMYAVMRFGKSFTSLCCAKESGAKFVVVVSAKADVKDEWKKTVEIPKNFEDYDFLESKDLTADENILKEKLGAKRRIVLFLTLQDLQGEKIKEKHKAVFTETVDLLIVDETHFGARAESYGKVLRNPDFQEDEGLKKVKFDDEFTDIEKAEKQIKSFRAKVKLHLSGTPYRILMGSEFQKDDIICFCQFADIVKEQESWDKENILKDDVKEWDNPYYGFPQMIRFAFNPNSSSRKKLEELKKNGVSYAFSALFKPKSIKKDENNEYKKFVYEKEILELLEAIDGSKADDELMPFLDYDKFKKGKMCRHIVAVLPYCASCDALEEFITSNKAKFKNLNSYKIINISGLDNAYKKVSDVKNEIRKAEKENIKTLTLTVNRMLTGSTVEQWDTMLYFKDTSSPQEYDQAVFRLQNQYIKILEDKAGNKIKFNMKPQTLLVDFDPLRLFQMQEKKSLIYNVNTDESGNNKLEERLREELRISPVIAANAERLVQITPADIMKAVSEYSRNKGVAEETVEIPVDLNLMKISDIYAEIEKQGKLGSKEGFAIKAADGEGNDLDIENPVDSENDGAAAAQDESKTKNPDENSDGNETKDLIQKWRTYYARILFFAFLTKDRVKSLQDIIDCASSGENPRILKNLSLKISVLELIRRNMEKFGLSQLDYKIDHLNELSADDKIPPLQRAKTALTKFGRLSESEVVTPEKTCDEMVSLLPDSCFESALGKNRAVLDINSKMAEFAISIYKKYESFGRDLSDFKDHVYSIPSSTYTYEFTRKVYEILGLNTECIAKNFVSYDLLKIRNKDGIDFEKIRLLLSQNKPFDQIRLEDKIEITTQGNENMKFEAVIGNPPYQEESAVSKKTKNGQTPRTNIFHYFQIIANELVISATSMIYPGGRWIHRSGKGLFKFGIDQINDKALEKVEFYPKSQDLFKDIELDDGISIVVKNKIKTSSGFNYVYKENGISETVFLDNPDEDLIPLNPKNGLILQKLSKFVRDNNLKYLHERILPRSLFGIESDFVENNKNKVKVYSTGYKLKNNEIKLLTNDKAGSAGRTSWFIADRDLIETNSQYIDEFQVVVSSAHPGGQSGRSNQIEVIDNHSAFGRSRVALASFKTKIEAINFYNYCNTVFIKFMFLMTDESLSSLGLKVPDMGDYTNQNKLIDFSDDLDRQLYKLANFSESEIAFIEKNVKAME